MPKVKPRERAFKQFKSPVLNVLRSLSFIDLYVWCWNVIERTDGPWIQDRSNANLLLGTLENKKIGPCRLSITDSV